MWKAAESSPGDCGGPRAVGIAHERHPSRVLHGSVCSVYCVADLLDFLVEFFWLICIHIMPRPEDGNCLHVGLRSQWLDAGSRVAIYAGSGSKDHWNWNVRMQATYPLKHWPFGPPIRNRHVFESCLTTWGLYITVVDVLCHRVIFKHRGVLPLEIRPQTLH